ncbi:MAG: holo-ACP synthase [Rhodospirillaceae bacterium]|nr:holo-ACP synthase [Rhodospirillaceae bacterium]|tara:strand:- start:932 stop:1345 length:414 start_codon:yes stop_codon:yes gene_type:complete
MIVGLGQDICESKRIHNTIERFGARFIHRIFTEREQQSCSKRLRASDCYARRFAAKEAVSKALGTGFRKGVFWKNISIINLPGGKPSVVLSGGALERLNRLVPEGCKPQIEISLTDDSGLAYAIVIISANPTLGTRN